MKAGRHQAPFARSADLMDRLRDQILAPLRQQRAESDRLTGSLRAMETPAPGVDVNPLTARFFRCCRLQPAAACFTSIGPRSNPRSRPAGADVSGPAAAHDMGHPAPRPAKTGRWRDHSGRLGPLGAEFQCRPGRSVRGRAEPHRRPASIEPRRRALDERRWAGAGDVQRSIHLTWPARSRTIRLRI